MPISFEQLKTNRTSRSVSCEGLIRLFLLYILVVEYKRSIYFCRGVAKCDYYICSVTLRWSYLFLIQYISRYFCLGIVVRDLVIFPSSLISLSYTAFFLSVGFPDIWNKKLFSTAYGCQFIYLFRSDKDSIKIIRCVQCLLVFLRGPAPQRIPNFLLTSMIYLFYAKILKRLSVPYCSEMIYFFF